MLVFQALKNWDKKLVKNGREIEVKGKCLPQLKHLRFLVFFKIKTEAKTQIIKLIDKFNSPFKVRA